MELAGAIATIPPPNKFRALPRWSGWRVVLHQNIFDMQLLLFQAVDQGIVGVRSVVFGFDL